MSSPPQKTRPRRLRLPLWKSILCYISILIAVLGVAQAQVHFSNTCHYFVYNFTAFFVELTFHFRFRPFKCSLFILYSFASCAIVLVVHLVWLCWTVWMRRYVVLRHMQCNFMCVMNTALFGSRRCVIITIIHQQQQKRKHVFCAVLLRMFSFPLPTICFYMRIWITTYLLGI